VRAIDITGQAFGRLTVLCRVGRNSGHAMWLCRCNCPQRNEVVVSGSRLHRGETKSCGCFRRECTAQLGKQQFKHGHTSNGGDTPEYNSWRAMIKRCTNRNHEAYSRYGGRGITIDARWLGANGFKKFLADMGARPAGKTLDRINTNGNYEPTNCRWATSSEQHRNTRTTKLSLDKARRIRKLAVEGKKPSQIAHFFRISNSHVHAVLQGACWKEAA
jgi:hypothetical protein